MTLDHGWIFGLREDARGAVPEAGRWAVARDGTIRLDDLLHALVGRAWLRSLSQAETG